MNITRGDRGGIELRGPGGGVECVNSVLKLRFFSYLEYLLQL